MHAIYISDLITLKKIIKRNQYNFKNFLLITSSLEVAFFLEMQKIQFIDVQNFINLKDIDRNKKIAHILSNDLFIDSKINTLLQGELIFPLETALNSYTAFSRIIKKYKIELLETFLYPKKAVIRTGPAPLSEALFSISESILCNLAILNNIKLKSHQIIKSRNFLEYKKLAVSNKLKIDQTFKNFKKNKSENIIIYETNMQRDEVEVISRRVNSEQRFNLVYLNQNILDSFTSLQKNHKENRFLQKKIKVKYQVRFKNILEPLMFQFDKLADELKRCDDHSQAIKKLFIYLAPKAIILGHDGFAVERNLVKIAKEFKIKTISMVHTGIGFNFHLNNLVGLSDKLVVWNKNDYKNLIRYQVSKNRIFIAGSLQYEKYIKNSSATNKNKKELLQKNKFEFNLQKPIILILTAEINTAFTSHAANLKKHRDALRTISELANKHKNINFIFKPHPAYDYHEIYSDIAKSSTNIYFLPKIQLDEFLLFTDWVMLINYATTASVHSLLRGVPIIYYCNALYEKIDWKDSLESLPIFRTKNIRELDKFFLKLKNNKNLISEKYFETSLSNILNINKFKKHPSELFTNHLLNTIPYKHKMYSKNFHFNNFINKINSLKKSQDLTSLLQEHSSLSFYDWHFIMNLLGVFKVNYKIVLQISRLVAIEKSAESKLYSWHTLFLYYILGIASSNYLSLMQLLSLFRYFLYKPYVLFRANKFFYKSLFSSQLNSKFINFLFIRRASL